MTNAATVGQDAGDDAPMDPNTIVELNVVSKMNAGKAPSTRWGKVAFDENGEGKVKMPLKDIALFSQLKWLRPEDEEKYLGISHEAAAQVTTQDNTELQAKLDASNAANVRLAQRNAELEAKMDEIMSKYQKEYDAFRKDVDEKMQSVHADLDKAMSAHDALATENASLKAQLAALQPAQETAKSDAKAEKAEKTEKKGK